MSCIKYNNYIWIWLIGKITVHCIKTRAVIVLNNVAWWFSMCWGADQDIASVNYGQTRTDFVRNPRWLQRWPSASASCVCRGWGAGTPASSRGYSGIGSVDWDHCPGDRPRSRCPWQIPRPHDNHPVHWRWRSVCPPTDSRSRQRRRQS